MILNKIVLSDFQAYTYGHVYKQADLLKKLAWKISAAKCVTDNIKNIQLADKIFVDTLADVNRFAISEQYVNRRQFINAAQLDSQESRRSVPSVDTEPDIKGNPSGLRLEKRMELYRRVVLEVFQAFYSENNNGPDEIIHTTCSGYLSPSPAQMLALHKNWLNTKVTHCYHMGCYGAVPAVRIALGSMAASQLLNCHYSKVDIVHTEFLSLHLDVTHSDIEHIINMTLFADGFIKYSAFFDNEVTAANKRGLKILACVDEIIPDSLQEMSWIPTAYQFKMRLSNIHATRSTVLSSTSL